MMEPSEERQKQIDALAVLGEIEVGVSEKRTPGLTPDVAELLTWHSEVAEDDYYSEQVREIHRMTVEALKALADVALERDAAHANLVEEQGRADRAETALVVAWDRGVDYGFCHDRPNLSDNPYLSRTTK